MFSVLSVVLSKVRLFPQGRHKEKIDRTKRRVTEPHSSLLFVDQSGARILAPLCDKETVQVVALKQSCGNTHTHTYVPVYPRIVIIRDDVGALIDEPTKIPKIETLSLSLSLSKVSLSRSIEKYSPIPSVEDQISLGIGESRIPSSREDARGEK